MIQKVELRGVDRLVSSLAAVTADLPAMGQAPAEAGRIVASTASTGAPRRTGRLAGSIVPVVDGAGGVVVGSDLIYAPPIHNGWAAHHIEPHPFLTTAADRTEAQWVGAYEKELTRDLARVKGV